MRKLTQFENALLRQLHDDHNSNAKRVLKRTSRQFVLDYGWFYTPAPLPMGVTLAAKAECYNNALRLVLDNSNLVYVEGFAVGKDGLPIHHAWVTDRSGRAIDNTWDTPGIAYAGVPFKAGVVSLIGLKNQSVGSLIDDWEHDWPLLQQEGDHPERWLEIQGNGSRKLT
jgi:hypothetical protein